MLHLRLLIVPHDLLVSFIKCVTNYQQKLVYIRNWDVTLGDPSLRSAPKWYSNLKNKGFQESGKETKHIKSILQQYSKQEIKDLIIKKYGTYLM